MVFIHIMPALQSDLILFLIWFLHWLAVPILGLSTLQSFFSLILIHPLRYSARGEAGWMALIVAYDTPTKTFFRIFLCASDDPFLNEPYNSLI